MNRFLDFLSKNDTEKRFFTLPEFASDPNLEEEAKDYYSDLEHLENREYYLLNGYEDSTKLEAALKRLFNQFKFNALEKNIKDKKGLCAEVQHQLNSISIEIEKRVSAAEISDLSDLAVLYKTKLSYCEKALEFLKNEIKKEPGKIRSKVFFSYTWLITPDELIPKAYYLMVGKWIGQKTTLEEFRNIFFHKPIEECNPIWWYEDPIIGLVFFIDRMKQKKIIDDGGGKRFNIQLLKRCFRNSSGKEFPQKNISQIRTNMHRDIAPTKKDAIDDLIKKITP